MIVLHGSALEGQLVLWAEMTPETPAGSRRRGRARNQGAPTSWPEMSPFDPGTDRLVKALAEAIGRVKKGQYEVGTWVAWLPTARGVPIPSSSLVAEPPSNGFKPSLAPWGVTGATLDVPAATELLAACVGQTTLAAGLVVGSTLAYWANALRLAGALVARQQYLPGVQRQGETFHARWEPVVAGAEAPRLASLARSMPHAARALTRHSWTTPGTAPGAVLNELLGTLVDHLVRSALAEPESQAPRRRGRKPAAPRRPAFASVHDQWSHALRTPDGRMVGDPAELARLAEQVQRWRRPVEVTASAPFRLCFRLEEPDAEVEQGRSRRRRSEPDNWYVRYLLQATDDPSLLLPASEAFGRTPRALGRRGFRPREFVLTALGQAAALCPRIEASLRDPAPGGYTLDVHGAHEFLNERAWLLEQAGFGVLLPAWWTRKGTKLRLGVRAVVKSPRMTSKAGLSLESILKFGWEVALGDQKLTYRELQALARLKAPLVKVRGQWVQLSAEEIQAALDFWKARGQTMPARQAVHLALGVTQPPGGLVFEGVEATGWLAGLLDQLQGGAGFEELPPPEGFRGTLRPYQQRGYSWLGFLGRWGFGACLADDMGLGKTIQTLAIIQRHWEQARSRRPTLLICPMSVVGNWQKEAARFTPELPVMVHHGLGRTKGAAFQKKAKEHALVISSYALLHRDFDHLKGVPWAGVVLDEAQNIKNPQTKQAQAARTLPAENRVALTGTPVENHVGDLWSIMEFLNPGLLGSQAEFKRSFHIPIQANRDPEAARRLQRITGPFILRRLKTDKSIIADLPDKLEMKVYCNLTREQATLYQAVADDAAEAIAISEGIQRKGIVLATLAKLKQVCNHPVQFLGDNSAIPDRPGKLARLTEMLEEALAENDRALIFSQFSEMGAILVRHLQETFGREVLFLHGGVPKAKRDRMVERFQARANGAAAPPLFVLTVKAGGTGLNLTAANRVFHFDRWWNPAVEDQATDRAFRIGQTRKVQVHKFVCVGTLEEKIDELITTKQQVAGSVVGSGEDWLTKLSTEELRDLLTLRREAIGE